jgi:hypothetical protein
MIKKISVLSTKVNCALDTFAMEEGFYPDKRDSKLYFEQPGMNPAAQNHLPHRGVIRSEVANHFRRNDIQMVCMTHFNQIDNE